MDERDDEFMDELMLDVWDGLKEEPCSKKNYPAKKKPSKKQKCFRIHYRFDGMDFSEIKKAYSADQAITVFCKLSDSWYVKKEIARKTRGFWIEEIKEENIVKKELSLKDWEKYEAVEAECFGQNHYPAKGKGMTIVISSGYMSIHLSLKNKYTLSIIDDTEWRENHGEPISVTYEIDEDTAGYLDFEVFAGINIFTKCRMPENFGYYVSCVKETLQAAGIIEKNNEKSKEESEMAKEKMNLDELVAAANAQAEAVDDNNAVEEAQQEQIVEEVVEETEENVEEVINMANEENKKVEAAKEVEQQVAQETVAKKLANKLTLHKADGSEIVIKANVIKNVDKDGKAINTRGKIMGFSDKLKKQVEIGSFVIGGGYSLPIFMIKCRGLKNETFKPIRDCNKENRTVRFHGSKNYFVLLSLLMNKEEIETAKAAEIARFFPPICERYESKGVEKNISVTVALDGETISLTGWVQREWRPLYLENEDRTITVRWDFGKGYQDPSIKYNGHMLRKNHDGISGNPDDAKVFEAIKAAILAELNKG